MVDDGTAKKAIKEFNRIRPVIQSYFLNKGFDADECEDLTQETFSQAFRRMEELRDIFQFKTWLFRIAENVVRKAIRSKRKMEKTAFKEVPDSGVPRTQDARLEGLLTQELLGSVRKALEELPPQMQRCVLLYVLQERRYSEIADLLRLPIGTVKSHIHGARTRLKETLGDQFDGFGR